MIHFYEIFPSLFDFTFRWPVLLSLLAVSINLGLAIFILRKGIENPVNRWFVLFLLCLTLWGLGEFLGRISANLSASIFWSHIPPPGWVFMSVMFFSFVLVFTGKDKILNNFLVQLCLYGPGLIFLFLAWITELLISHHPSKFEPTFYGWDSPMGSLFPVYLIWMEFFFIASLYLLFKHYFQVRDPIKKNQTRLIIIGLLIPLVIGTVTDAIFPIFDITFIETAILFTTIMAIVVSYAIIKYKLFIISPIATMSAIVETMTEALIVINPSLYIGMVNKGALDLLGYSRDELVGKHIKMLIPQDRTWKTFNERSLIPLSRGRRVKNLETKLLTKEGKEIPVNFSASVMKEPGQKPTGIVAIAIDITQTKNLIRNLEKTTEELRISKYNLEAKLAKITEAR